MARIFPKWRRSAEPPIVKGRRVVLALAAGLILALASTAVPGRTRAHYPDIMGCEAGCVVAAAGWPAPYAVDYLGISPVGSADLVGALFGLDRFRPAAFGLTWLFWTAVTAALVLLRRAWSGVDG